MIQAHFSVLLFWIEALLCSLAMFALQIYCTVLKSMIITYFYISTAFCLHCISYHNYTSLTPGLKVQAGLLSFSLVCLFGEGHSRKSLSKVKKNHTCRRGMRVKCNNHNCTKPFADSATLTLSYLPTLNFCRPLYVMINTCTRNMTVETSSNLTASSCDAKSDSRLTILSSIGGSLFLSTSNSWPRIFT